MYISNIGDAFKFGLASMYTNAYDLISKQDYIQEYKIHNGEHYDINLSSWRCNRYLYHTNWYWVFSDEYSIEWGKHKWIYVEKDEKWCNKVLVNQPVYRFEIVDYQKLYHKYGDRLVFIAFKETNYVDYENFVEKTGINIEYYNPTSVYDVAVAINPCELFIGSASGFMAMAMSIKAPLLYLCNSSDAMSGNMHTLFNNVEY